MAYHVESFLVCDACHGARVSMPGHNGRDVLEREAARRGWERMPLERPEGDATHGNCCRGCVAKLQETLYAERS